MDEDELEAVVLGGAERYTPDEMAAASRLTLPEVRRLWRAMGFPDVGEARAFTDADLNALLRVAALMERGLIDMDGIVEVARSMGQTSARLAEWQVEALGRRVTDEGLAWQGDTLDALSGEMSELLPEFELLLGYVWRRQLAATLGRYLEQPDAKEGDSESVATVGFADMVSFTRLSRQLDEVELAGLVQAFEAASADLVHGIGARLVKTLGDEVMFVAAAPGQAIQIALSLHTLPSDVRGMPQLRIGLATGSVLNRMGDVFGTTVNRASRMTALARPGTTIVDGTTSEALHALSGFDVDYTIKALTPRPVRGLGIVRPYAVTAAE